MTIKDLNFIDLYLQKDSSAGWTKSGENLSGRSIMAELSEEDLQDAALLNKMCDEKEKLLNFPRDYNVTYDDVFYRVAYANSEAGPYRTLRRQPKTLRKLHELSIPKWMGEHLMTANLKGLIIICGDTSSGKTTTASAVVAARLRQYGGIAMSAEDPPEMPLQGKHPGIDGTFFGLCFQETISSSGGFSYAMEGMLRRAPNMIYLGEIRDPLTAEQAVMASFAGKLVIATLHAGSIVQAIDRLIEMANGKYRGMLAAGLRMVIMQTFTVDATTKAEKVKFQSLFLDDKSQGARSKIINNQTMGLVDDITLQYNKSKQILGRAA